MIKYLAGSLSVINANIILVLLLSLASIYIYPGNMFLLAVVSLIAQIFLYPVIYGRLVETLQGKPKTELLPLFKTHAWNYYTVIIIVYVPVHVIINVMNLIAVDQKEMQFMVIVSHISLLSLIAILFIYILPLIFLTRENVFAIPLGLKFLFNNLTSSILLIALAVIYTVMMHPAIKWGIPELLNMDVQDSFMIFVAYGFVHNAIMFTINFIRAPEPFLPT